VYAFWKAVLTHTDALCARIADTAVTVEEWTRQKSVQDAVDPDELDLAFSTFFLNRTNRSGIIKGGIIGGKNQTGDWKLDARYNRVDLVRRIKKVARHASRITLTQRDAADYLRNALPTLPVNTFLYLDPPYFVKGQGLYQNAYAAEDHAEIAQAVRGLNRPWLVSYDAAPEIMDLYAGHTVLTYGLCYSAADRYRGSEAMFYSPGLAWPEVTTPANVKPKIVDAARLAAIGA
jgi:DNA adenine methylase